MAYKLIYHSDVKKSDLSKIDNKNKSMIKRAIEERLAIHPEIHGKPLQRSLKGYWKMRVGNYRVVLNISEQNIIILGIMDRKNVYSHIEKRKMGNESA